MSGRTDPPRWARACVARIVRRSDREFLLADLDEEFTAKRRRGQRALLWYFVQGGHAAVTRRLRSATLVDAPRRPRGAMALSTDLQSAWRNCWRQPSTTAAIVLSLALGLGMATAMFSVVQAVLLAPLPYRQPDRLVTLWSTLKGYDRTWLASIDARDIRARSHFADDVAIWTWRRVALTGIGDAASLTAGVVTPNTFAVLGAAPLYGRVFTDAEALAATRPGTAMCAVLGYDLWRGTFRGDVSVIGRTVTIDGRPATILGVMPPRFHLPTDFGNAAPTDLWIPIVHDPSMNEGGFSYFGAARLRAGVSLPAFNAELSALAADLVRSGRHPVDLQFTVFARSIDDDVFGTVRPSMRLLVLAVLLVLLIACANAGSLLVARAESRRREWATRAALGAGHWRLVRLQLAEGALLSIAGGTLGLGLAVFAKRTLEVIGATAIPRASDVALDWRVVSCMLALSVGTTVVSAVAPAVHAVRLNLVDGLKDGTRTASAGRGRLRLRALLVVSQLSFGLVLLTGTGLLAHTLLAMRQIDLGFQPARVLTARVALPPQRYSTPDQVSAYLAALTGRLRQLPGVNSAGVVRVLPLAQTIGYWPVTIDGYQPPPGERATGDWQAATPGALEALGERLVKGRLFAESDTAATPVVVLVNEAMAQRYWPGRDPIGHRIRFSNDPPLVWGTVVGIVGDVRHNGVTNRVTPKFYLPYTQFSKATGDKPLTDGTIVLSASGNPRSQVAALRSAALAIDREVPISSIRPMSEVVDTALTTPRLTSDIVTGFAVVALVLSALGLFSLLAYMVAQRAAEIGIRIAIGASPDRILWLVLGQGLRVSALGLAVGLVFSLLAARTLSSVLSGIRPWDPITWILAPATLLAITILASLVPARRAAAINPLRTLR